MLAATPVAGAAAAAAGAGAGILAADSALFLAVGQ